MPELTQDIISLARSQARDVLAMSNAFRNMDISEQKNIYQALVKENAGREMRKKDMLSSGMGTKGASSDIDDKRHEKGFTDTVDAFEDLVDSVDFPQFVKDLIKGVFDANINVMRAQTEDYIKLLKQSTKSVGEFIKLQNDDQAFSYLAENKSDEFNIAMDGGKISLTKPDGQKVDMDDNEMKAKIMEAKIALAQEERALWRELLLMGITRLVVEKGVIEAGVIFDVQSNREAVRSDMATRNEKTKLGGGFGGGILGSFGFGGSTTRTKVMVSSANSKNTDQLKANLTGKVKLEFKTDYFKLDNFATMYGAGAAGGPGKPAQPQGALPPK